MFSYPDSFLKTQLYSFIFQTFLWLYTEYYLRKSNSANNTMFFI